ncbi:hypothetical protein PT974_11642 [Cladobotryum mycophilum]|uniref:FHA domain-containing protein n=1 Tax=Cladobotryum mycophilum TaxID=491253 RepID=A0ABR0S6R4_9HYPO
MASPTYSDEAVITLTVVDPPSSMSFPDRRILLSKWKPTMPIGRTSKRNSDYEAAENNAWIDSAVMSRDHAELRLDTQQQKIILKDVGSLHGTFCNNTRLGQNQGHALQTGDVIQFGIPIDRGHDTFPPCNLRAAIEFGASSPEERPMVFAVPDETDVEDMSSDDEDVGVEHSSRILEHNQIRPALPNTASNVIDLTSHNYVDLTSNDNTIQRVDFSPANSRETSSNHVRHEMADVDQPSSPESSVADSELPGSRIPSPPETVEISEEEPMSSPESYDEGNESDGDEEENYPMIEGQEVTNNDTWGADRALPASVTLQSMLAATPIPGTYIREEMRALYGETEFEDTDSYLGTSRLPPIRGFHEPIALADIMGPRGGNSEYWEAREQNRSNFIGASPIPAPIGFSFRTEQPENRQEMTLEIAEEQEISTGDLAIDLAGMEHEEAHAYPSDRMDVTSSTAEFLVQPPPVEENTGHMVPDDTSAYQYEITKKAIDEELAKRGMVREETLARINEDLIRTRLQSSPAPQVNNRSNKRKASDMSEAAPEEEGPNSIEPITYPSTITHPNASSDSYNDARSPKRFRRVAEAFGYAALGGVAVMSALIATAPTL